MFKISVGRFKTRSIELLINALAHQCSEVLDLFGAKSAKNQNSRKISFCKTIEHGNKWYHANSIHAEEVF